LVNLNEVTLNRKRKERSLNNPKQTFTQGVANILEAREKSKDI